MELQGHPVFLISKRKFNEKGDMQKKHNPLIFLVHPAGIEPAAHGLGICLSNFYGFLPCSLMLFFFLYYQCVISLQVVFYYIAHYPDIGYCGSKMVAGK
jgi:hypothetical protein